MIEIKNLTKVFDTSDGKFTALENISLTIGDGDIFGIIGMSGAGKSTLVRCINMLERPTDGSVIIGGRNLSAMTDSEIRKERRKITMIFQGFNLLMQRTCLGNVCFPLELSGVRHSDAVKRGMELLETVGLADKANAYPAMLSGGQQQRVAIARALATEPEVLLCDEATSALDPTTTNSILELIRDINRRMGITVIIITHQMSVVESICRHVAIIDGGKIAEQGEVGEVFAHPKSDAAKKLVFPDGDAETAFCKVDGYRMIRVVFNGAVAANRPLIAAMARDEGIEANISYASTRGIDGKAYGSMILGIEDNDEIFLRAKKYLTGVPGVTVEEVSMPNE